MFLLLVLVTHSYHLMPILQSHRRPALPLREAGRMRCHPEGVRSSHTTMPRARALPGIHRAQSFPASSPASPMTRGRDILVFYMVGRRDGAGGGGDLLLPQPCHLLLAVRAPRF